MEKERLFLPEIPFSRIYWTYGLSRWRYKRLLQTIRKSFSLSDEVIVLPGHGEATSIGYEKNITRFGRRLMMKRTAEFWMRISITLFLYYLRFQRRLFFPVRNISYPIYFAYTACSKLYKWINMTGIKNIPYDIPIIISFGIFIGIIYLIAIHILYHSSRS